MLRNSNNQKKGNANASIATSAVRLARKASKNANFLKVSFEEDTGKGKRVRKNQNEQGCWVISYQR